MAKQKRYKSDKLRFKFINKYLKGKEILDVGSKEGYVHPLLAKSNPDKNIYTLDLTEADFNLDLNKPWNIKKKFDTIIAAEIIEHIDNPNHLIQQIKKHLNQGGRLILTTPNAAGIQYIRNPEWCVFDEHGHNQAFTLPMLEKLLKKSKFKILHKQYINAFWRKNPLQIIPMIFNRLKTDLIIVGETE